MTEVAYLIPVKPAVQFLGSIIVWVCDGEIITDPWHGLEFDITTGQRLA